MGTGFSRRAVLAQMGAAGLAAASGGGLVVRPAYAALDDKTWYFLTNAEARFLAAACDVLIPADEYPSASEAGVVDFIDLMLGGPYGQGEGLYLQAPFAEGTPSQGYQRDMTPAALIRAGIDGMQGQGDALADMDMQQRQDRIQALADGNVQLPGGLAADFFDELLRLTNQGYFADPAYDGNLDYAGWQMIGFPGAYAYYTTEVGRHNLPYPAPPKGMSHVPGQGAARMRIVKTKGGGDG